MICLVYGTQEVMVQKKVDEILKSNLEEINDFTVTNFDAELISIQDIIADASTLPFGYSKKAVIVKNPFFLLTQKTPKVDFENDYLILNNFLEQGDSSSIIIFYTTNKIDERKEILKKIKAYGVTFPIEDIDKNQWFNITKNLFIENHVRIKDSDIEFFFTRVGNDLGQIMQEVEKLALYSKNITRDDIEQLVAKPLEENSFSLLDAMVNKDIIHALSIFQDLKLQNQEPIWIISTLANQLHLQFQVNSLVKERNSEKEIASILNIHPYRVKLMIGKMTRLPSSKIMSLLDNLANLDLKIKSGLIDRFQALELFIIENS